MIPLSKGLFWSHTPGSSSAPGVSRAAFFVLVSRGVSRPSRPGSCKLLTCGGMWGWVLGCVVGGIQHAPPAIRNSSPSATPAASARFSRLCGCPTRHACGVYSPTPAGSIKPHRPRARRAAPSRCADSRMEGTGKREDVNMGGAEGLLG